MNLKSKLTTRMEEMARRFTERHLVNEYGPEKYEAYMRSENYKLFNDERERLLSSHKKAYTQALEDAQGIVDELVNALKEIDLLGGNYNDQAPYYTIEDMRNTAQKALAKLNEAADEEKV